MKRRSPDVDPEGDNGLSGIVDGALLAGALEAAFAGTHVPLGADARRPLFKGTLDEFAVANAGDVALLRHLKNNVKKCGACGKVCGIPLRAIIIQDAKLVLADSLSETPRAALGPHG